MANFVEKWGDDIDSAVELALKELKLTKDQVNVTVLEQPSRGFLGLRKKLAKVRVEKKPVENKKQAVKAAKEKDFAKDSEKKDNLENLKNEKKVAVKEDTAVNAVNNENIEENNKTDDDVQKSSSEDHPADEKKIKEKRENHDAKNKKSSSKMFTKFTLTDDDTDVEPAQDAPAVKFVEDIAEKMNLTITAKAGIKDSTLYINLEGKDVGSLIGKRGQTLDSIQYLASIVQNKEGGKHTRVIINAEKYREKREKTLQQLAKRLSEKCIKSGRNVRLEPMNPYERKVIHSTLQSDSRVTTKSEGVEPNRRVVIEYVKK
jgi:spoIIIJ-associated protein